MAKSTVYFESSQPLTGSTITFLDDRYASEKGFYIDEAKISKYILDEDKPHSKEFLDLGYRMNEPLRLVEDIEREFKMEHKVDTVTTQYTTKFSIVMLLGVTEKKAFRTVWQDNGPEEDYRMITAYLDRRVASHE